MSPLAPAGTLGYPDWQRIQNWDSPVLLDKQNYTQNTAFSSPPMDVTNYGYVGVLANCLLNSFQLFMQWYLDSAATIGTATREFVLNQSVGNFMQVHTPNHGPWLVVSSIPIGGANYTADLRAVGTNRQSLLELIPSHPSLLEVATGVTANGATVSTWLGDYYSGPAVICVNPNGVSGWQWSMQYLNAAGALSYVGGGQVGALVQSFGVLIPSAPCVLNLFNNTGAPNQAAASVLYSATGAN